MTLIIVMKTGSHYQSQVLFLMLLMRMMMTSAQQERTVNVTKQYYLRSGVLPLLFGKQKFSFFLSPPKKKTPDRGLQTVLPY